MGAEGEGGSDGALAEGHLHEMCLGTELSFRSRSWWTGAERGSVLLCAASVQPLVELLGWVLVFFWLSPP